MEYLNKENKIEQWLSDAENISTIESMNVEFKKNFFQSINFSQQLNISLDKIKDINLLISAVESNYKINYNQFLEIANKGLMIKEVSNKYISDTLKYIGDNFTSEQVKELINIFATKENNGRIVINDNKIMFDSTIMKFMFDYIEKNYQNEEKEKAITKLYQNTNLNEHLFNAPMEFRTTLFLNGNNIDYSLLNTDSILKRFKNIYGEEKYNEYKETLKFVADNYYNSKLQNNISQLNKLMDYSLKKYINFFLKEKDIINTCNPKLVLEYVVSDLKIKQNIYNSNIENDVKQIRIANRINTDPINKKYLIEIIENTYGKNSVDFLEKRPGLCNINNIYSFKLLDPVVFDNFKEQFVQDLFNYNFPSIEKFTNIIKDKEDLELFKEHYHILTSIFGENCESMEKAFNNFNSFKDLLIDIKDKEINDNNYRNFIGLYCIDNVVNIKKASELEDLPTLISEYVEKNMNNNNQMEFIYKFFNLNKNQVDMYLNKIENDELEELDLTEMQALTIIKKVLENPIENINIIFKEENNIVEVLYSMNSTIQKIKEKKLTKIEDKLINYEKILNAVNNESTNTKLVNVEGMDIVFLGDLKGMTLKHEVNLNSSYSSNSNFTPLINPANAYNNYEGYDGLSTISCSITPIENMNLYNNTAYYFWNIQNKELVTVANQDAMVSHTPKLINSNSELSVSIPNEIENLESEKNNDNEIAFYRYIRDHNISSNNENNDRRILPDAASYTKVDDLKQIINSFGSNVILLCNGYGTQEEINKVTSDIEKAKILIAKEQIQKQNDNSTFNEEHQTQKSLGSIDYFLILSIFATIIMLILIFISLGDKL